MKYNLAGKILKHWVIISLVGFLFFIAGSLWTFSPTDSSWFYHATQLQSYKNVFGFLGSHSAALFIYLFGRAAFLGVFVGLYFILFYFFTCLVRRIQAVTEWDRAVGVVIGFVSMTALCQIYTKSLYDFSYPGGIVGNYILTYVLGSFDGVMQQIIVWVLLLCSVLLITRCSYLPVFLYIGKVLGYCFDRQKLPARIVFAVYSFFIKVGKVIIFSFKKIFDIFTGRALRKIDSSIVEFEKEENVDKDIEQVVQDLFWHDYIDVNDSKMKNNSSELWEKPVESQDESQQDFILNDQIEEVVEDLSLNNHDTELSFAKPADKAITSNKPIKKKYVLPSLSVEKVEQKDVKDKQDALAVQAKLLEEKLEQFDIKGIVVAMHSGPVVTLFEYQPDIKVKVSRILSLEDDLAMALKALSIRIIAPIPGRSVVGFEVANQYRQDVMMARILESQEFKKHSGALPMIFGQDTLGNDIIADLAKMPHLLIAGSTGSGKSVALNAMLVSLLCSLKPSELQLIIIDPKRLEFAAYDGIAHLVFPIITETKKAIPVLKWVVQTMEDRYKTMAKYGVRNISDYKIAAQKNKEMESMPLIVLIIDELADLMMTAGKAVEDSLARIAQMARAAGIHMIIATQRPSVDVITGMIKVNFPNRVAFKVTSKIDSRTILDSGGAEKLLGRGDMLFLDASKSHLVRVHGAYISDKEIHDVVSQIKGQCKAQYLDIFEQFGQRDNDELLDGDDELYQEIVDFLQELDEVSISMLQRRFRIGYNRSARIISILESKGLIMTVDGGKTRRVVK